MEFAKPTVEVTCLEGSNTLRMRWQHHVLPHDVAHAFQQITDRLDVSDASLYVVADLTSNPRIPLKETISALLAGPYRHPRLAEWLIVGSNLEARSVANALFAITRRSNVRWFDTERDALDYLYVVTNAQNSQDNPDAETL